MTTGTTTEVAPARTGKRGVAKFFWAMSGLSAVLGGLVGVGGQMIATGAPQEAAAAALGCVIVIAPHCFARAVDELTRA